MTALPASLSGWREQLRLFPDDLASALGRLVLRLAPAVDSLARRYEEPEGDIDGFDGIANRGSYERLLASEWVLSRAAPLEFLRRAAAGEQAFLHLAQRTPAQPERILALFDAGPDQLGGCRIVQLALLVLLRQRCESRGRELHWQLLHHQGETPRTSLDESSVRAFLQGRSGLRASASTVRSWLEQHNGERIWLIGAQRITHHGESAFARLTLKERITLDAPAVDVLLEAGPEPRRVTLLLPEPEQCVRLLRDPFEQVKPRRAEGLATSGELLLSPSGRRLFCCSENGALLSVSVPNSPRAQPGKLRRYRPSRPDHCICAVDARQHSVAWLSYASGQLLTGYSKSPSRHSPLTAPGPQPAKLSPLAWSGEETAYYLTAERTLWHVDLRTQRGHCVAEGVRAWLQTTPHDIVAVDRCLDTTDRGPGLLELKPYTAACVLRRGSPWQEVRLSSRARGHFTLAVGDEGGWCIEDRLFEQHGAWLTATVTTLHAPSGTSVLGVEADAAGLWLLESSRREVSIVRRSSSRCILKTEADIEHARLASNASVLALRTSVGELLVVSAKGQLLYRGAGAA